MNQVDFCGNNIESYILGICFICTLCVFGVCFLRIARLPSQSGKAERREIWNKKQKNKRSANIRKQKAHAAIEQRKEESRKVKLNKQVMKSQAGQQPRETSPIMRLLRCLMLFFSFGTMSYAVNRWSFAFFYNWAEDGGIDKIATLWNWIRRAGPYENDSFALIDFVKESYAELVKIFSDFNISIPDFKAFIPVITFDSKTFDLIKRSKMCADLCTIISMIVTIGWLNHFEFNVAGLSFFKSVSLRRNVSGVELIEAILKYIKHMSSCMFNALSGQGICAFWQDAVNSQYEDKYTYLMTTAPLLECGRLENDGVVIDPHEFDRKLAEHIETTLELLNGCKDGERTYYGTKLNNLRKLHTQRILAQKRGIRAAPLGILLYGESSTGKSVMCDVLMKYILEVNGFDATPETIVSLNEFDKFQSEYRTHHNGVIFDDLANGKVERTDGNPLMKVIQFINNNPCAALNPNLEMKGNVMIEPKVVIATTNVKDVKASAYSNEPLAIARRFPITITQSVRPEYRQDGNHMLDGSKLSADTIVDDFALFTVEKPVPEQGTVAKTVAYKIYEHNGVRLENVGLKELLAFLKDVSRSHFSQQSSLLAKKEKLAECSLCEHGNFPEYCDECTLDSQVGALPDFAECREWLLQLEERVCSMIDARIRAFLLTSMGTFLLAAIYRRSLKDYLWSDIKAICGMILIVLLNNGSARFMFAVIISYCLFVWWNNRRLYNNMIIRFSTVPRPSRVIANMSVYQKTMLITMMGGIAAFKILFALIRKWRSMPAAQGSAPIVFKNEGDVCEHPSWGDSKYPERDPENNIKVAEHGMTMSTSQLVETINRKLCFITIQFDEDTNTFCNALPIDTGVFIIPGHVIKSVQRAATIVRTRGNIVRCNISRENTYRIPSSDLALWYVPEAGPQRNLVDLFPENQNAFKRVEAEMLYNDHGVMKNYGRMECTPGRVVTSEGGIFKGLNYYFPGQTFDGLCMGVLVGSAPYTHIAGFHLAGNGSRGAAGVLTREVLKKSVDKLMELSIAFKSHSSTPLETTTFGTTFGPLRKPHEKSSVYAAPDEPKMQVYGDHTLPVGNQTSSVVTTVISKAVEEVMGIEKIHGRPYKMTDPVHWEVDLQAKTTTAYDFEDKFVAKAYEDYSQHVHAGITDKDLEKVGKLNLDAVLAGYDGVAGINAMNFATSCGFGLKGKKSAYVEKSDRHVENISCPRDLDPLVLEEVDKMRNNLRQGKSINAIFKGSLKDEPTKLTKKKVRVFAACNIAFTIIVREYFLSLTKLMLDHPELFECAVGVVAESPQWTDFMNHIYKYGEDRCIAGDYAAFDGRMSPKFMLLGFKLLISLAERSGNYDQDDLTVMRGLATEITNPLYDHHGTLVRFFGSNPSGHPLTVNINSLVNSLYMRYCYFALADKAYSLKMRIPKFADVVALMTYGDDNIMSVKTGHDYFNHTAIAGVLADAGIKYTMAEKDAESVPFVNAKETSFLKRASVWDEELQLYRAPIEMSSIAKTLHAQVKSDVLSPEQHSAEAIRGVAEKFFEYGREVYEERVEQLNEVARRTGLVGYIGNLGSYDDRLQAFRKKYDWQ